METVIREIEMGWITPNLRLTCAVDTLDDLCRSIRCEGQTEPISVYFAGESFRILDGEKRWRACRKLGMKKIKAIIIQGDTLLEAQQ